MFHTFSTAWWIYQWYDKLARGSRVNCCGYRSSAAESYSLDQQQVKIRTTWRGPKTETKKYFFFIIITVINTLLIIRYCCQKASMKRAVLPLGVWWWMKKWWGQATGWSQRFVFPCVLWYCFLCDRIDNSPIKHATSVIFRRSLLECARRKPAYPCSPWKWPLKWR